MSEITAPPQPAPAGPPPAEAPRQVAFQRWTPGRVATLVTGLVGGLVALAMVLSGGVALTADRVVRDEAGFLSTGPVTVTGDGYALTSEPIKVDIAPGDDEVVAALLGDVRVQATGTDPAVPVFVGVGPTVEVDRYLSGVARDRVTGIDGGTAESVELPGTVTPGDPSAQTFWVERSNGPGEQAVVWTPRSGNWTVVVMRADGARSPSVDLEAEAQAPVVTWVSGLVLAAGLALLALSTALVLVPVVRAVRSPRT